MEGAYVCRKSHLYKDLKEDEFIMVKFSRKRRKDKEEVLEILEYFGDFFCDFTCTGYVLTKEEVNKANKNYYKLVKLVKHL